MKKSIKHINISAHQSGTMYVTFWRDKETYGIYENPTITSLNRAFKAQLQLTSKRLQETLK